MGVNPIQAKSILQKSDWPERDDVITPCTGCVHGCVCCYARFMKRFTGRAEPGARFWTPRSTPQLARRNGESK